VSALRPFLFVLTTALAAVAPSGSAVAARHGVSSLTSSAVTVYGAKWCNACRALERGLSDRKIPFEVIDVDDNPAAFARARTAAGASGAIPLTGVARSTSTVWVVGADVDAVERALRAD
jgi:hypothetical protein